MARVLYIDWMRIVGKMVMLKSIIHSFALKNPSGKTPGGLRDFGNGNPGEKMHTGNNSARKGRLHDRKIVNFRFFALGSEWYG